MALTDLQRRVCRRIAAHRVASGESYVAGGVALNELMGTSRVSRDIDLFHDTLAALESSWTQDRRLLEADGLEVRVVRERPGLIEADVIDGEKRVRLEWSRDSAYRFFPLQEHPELGLTLHPFDLATNKVLALIGRVEVRDWVDVIESDRRIQPLGYLAWAASGKDPGFGPGAILETAGRTARYSAAEVGELAYEGDGPDAAALGREWHRILDAARATIAVLPPQEVGACVLAADASLLRVGPEDLAGEIESGGVRFHRGSIRGAMPVLLDPTPEGG